MPTKRNDCSGRHHTVHPGMEVRRICALCGHIQAPTTRSAAYMLVTTTWCIVTKFSVTYGWPTGSNIITSSLNRDRRMANERGWAREVRNQVAPTPFDTRSGFGPLSEDIVTSHNMLILCYV